MERRSYLALCFASCSTQLLFCPENALSGWHRPHCWQNRCGMPALMNIGSLMCTSQIRQRWWYVLKWLKSRWQLSTWHVAPERSGSAVWPLSSLSDSWTWIISVNLWAILKLQIWHSKFDIQQDMLTIIANSLQCLSCKIVAVQQLIIAQAHWLTSHLSLLPSYKEDTRA